MSKTWRYIKSYMVIDIDKVEDYVSKGYELVGGVALGLDGNYLLQAVALYDDQVTLNQPKDERDK